ncbi:PREDICTED: uncharacterized protein LOC105365839 [Ceratosolen solmsi marchali]|uniref:Uncharacterized protein LOC105365839 n=1 Tax=Ceratosolen solmsi marchali TaxID=326594 RepID=A0AAJ6YQH8_9HYME|nr:PREDICTED: uncharacterized protein LOC105365839 [Ceratosolen solmsi marchali]
MIWAFFAFIHEVIVNVFDPTAATCYGTEKHYCVNFELRMIDCLEAYGMYKGMKECEDFITDINECLWSLKSRKSVFKVREELISQYKKGERKDCFAKSPLFDIY